MASYDFNIVKPYTRVWVSWIDTVFCDNFHKITPIEIECTIISLYLPFWP